MRKKKSPKPKRSVTAEQLARHLQNHLCEWFDGFVVVGFVAGTDKEIVLHDSGTTSRTARALRDLLQEVEIPLPDES